MNANQFRAFLAAAIILALLGTAWMTRYEVSVYEGYVLLMDRWTGSVCTAGTTHCIEPRKQQK